MPQSVADGEGGEKENWNAVCLKRKLTGLGHVNIDTHRLLQSKEQLQKFTDLKWSLQHLDP